MNGLGQTLVLGLINGGIYGLLAVGVVLVYRGTGALNFAQGELGTFGLYAAWLFVTEWELPWLLGALAAIGSAALIGAGFERLVVRHMIEASRVSVAVATIGLLLLVIGVEYKFFDGANPRFVRGPIGGIGPRIFGVHVSPTQFLALAVTIAVGLALTVLLRRTDFGLAVLASAQDPTAVRLVGAPLARVSTFTWAAGAGISALAALLIEPTVGNFTPTYASVLFLSGLAAAVIGGLTNLPGAFVGGVVVGIIEVGSGRLFGGGALPDVKQLAVFVILLAVLVLRPGGLLTGLKLRAAA